MDIYEQLLIHEGKENKVYKDTEGIETIGVGRNLKHKGLSDDEIMYLLRNDVLEVKEALYKREWFNKLCKGRQKVVMDMVFNLGLHGLLSFRGMIRALKAKDYARATYEMKDSRWYNQVGDRAKHLVYMMHTGDETWIGRPWRNVADNIAI